MIKVLFIGSFLSKTRGTISISEKLAFRLKADGIDILLSSAKESKWRRFLEIIYYSFTFKGRIVHIDVFSGQAFIIAMTAAYISKLRKKKIIITLHGGKLPEFYKRNPKKITELFKKADYILTPSFYLKYFFENIEHRIIYLPNSIDLSKFPYVPELCKAPKLLWVRAFSSIYRPELALKALLEVRQYCPEAAITMVGPDNGELSRILLLLKELDLENSVFITGPVSNEVLFNYYHNHRVLLNTTSYESFGVAVMEAAACGIPVVSTPAGEIPLLWENGKDMLISNNSEPVNLAKLILEILNNPDKAESLRQQARQKAEKFDWEIIKQKWLKFLKD